MGAPSNLASEPAALGTQLLEDLVDALLLHRAHAVRAQPQRDPALLGFHPETLRVQVGQEAAALLVVGVGDAVTDGWLLAGDLADAGHTNNLKRFLRIERGRPLGIPGRALYQPGGGISRSRVPGAPPGGSRMC